MPKTGTSLLGLGSVGFGVLFIYSAYTRKHLFGADGILEQFVKSGGDFSKMKVKQEPKGSSLGSGTFRPYKPSSDSGTTGGTGGVLHA